MQIIELLNILKEGESTNTEFKMIPSSEIRKTACAFANTKGGRILIGVKDNGDPVGIKTNNWKAKVSDSLQTLRPMPEYLIEEVPISDVKIIFINIQESPSLVSTNNEVYIRVGTSNRPLSIEEIIEKSSESLRVFFDQIPSKINVDELDKSMLSNYLQRRSQSRGVLSDGDELETALRLKIIYRKNGGLFLTNGGILCFTKDPQKYMGNAVVRMIKFEDDEMRKYSFQKEFTGSLPSILESLERYFVDNLNRVGGFTVGFRRQDFLEYPLSAVREAIINAVIHRNYFDPADIRIFIFPNRLEIKNPGSFPPGVSIDNPEHKPRNPQIAQYFYDLGLTEKYGSGIKKIIRDVSEHPLTTVEFVVKPYNTTVIFNKSLTDINLDQINLKILESLKSGVKQSGEISRIIGLSKQATIDRIKNLRLLGFVKQLGEGSKTIYELGKSVI